MAQKRPYKDEDRLRRLYHEEGLSMAEMADRLDTTSGTIYRWMDKYDVQTREKGKLSPEKKDELDEQEFRQERWLREKHHEQDMQITEIADEAGVSHSAIVRQMDRYDIERQSFNRKNGYATFRTDHRGYEEWVSWTESGGKKQLGVHRLIAVAHHGIEAVKDMHVHHDDEIPWNNCPDNLKVWTEKRHRSYHAKKNNLHEYGAEATRQES